MFASTSGYLHLLLKVTLGDSWGAHWHKSVYERALSVRDLGHTCEGIRKKRGVGGPKTPHEMVWSPHLAAPRRGNHTRAESSQDVRYFSRVLSQSQRSGRV